MDCSYIQDVPCTLVPARPELKRPRKESKSVKVKWSRLQSKITADGVMHGLDFCHVVTPRSWQQTKDKDLTLSPARWVKDGYGVWVVFHDCENLALLQRAFGIREIWS
jgi:hypothetical protein